MMTMGSLFDGIGGFPLAAQRNGIITLWASEIEAFPIRVTKLRFPAMAHMGDITQLNGAELPPVDIICGGSPCQDLSVAGARAGLAGSRSGLFMEQVRIAKEMRDAELRRGRPAESVRPRYFLWENVPGAFSSGTEKGEDFRIVLEETCRIADGAVSGPRPPSGRWEPAGAILGTGFSLAWRVLDAQYWPQTPQRRRRIFLVADLGGTSAPEILFEQSRLFGDPAEGQRAWEGAAAAATGSAGTASGGEKDIFAFHINQREETIDLGGVAGALMATTNMQMQTFVAEGFDGCNGDLTGDVSATLGSNCGMSTGRNGVIAFAANQRNEVRDLYDIAGALGAQPGMKQQTFIAAGFCPETSASARGIGYQEDCAPTLKSGGKGAGVLCLNDQGGERMGCTYDRTATLRAQMRGHQPLVFENHTLDSRCTGPHDAAPTISAAYGTGGNNTSLVVETDTEPVYCITGNAVDHHAVFNRQRVDEFQPDDIASTQSARQHKDATDLILDTESKTPRLIRRLTPLECERLQGFPDGWTAIPGAADSARYKALGNSVAIPCVEYILRGIAYFLQKEQS